MDLLKVITTVSSLILQYPFEKHIKPDKVKLDRMYEEMKRDILASAKAANIQLTPAAETVQEKLSIEQIVERERTGDYCLNCVSSKHLMRAKDALSDASNIANDKGFNDVAEGKIQQAVLELNGAEKDLEMAQVPEQIKPAVVELKTQIRKLRNFLRQDQSGLEIATAFPVEQHEDMKKSLEVASKVTDMLIKYGYDVSKLQMRARAEVQLGVS